VDSRGHDPLLAVRGDVASLVATNTLVRFSGCSYMGEIEDFATARLGRAYFLSHTTAGIHPPALGRLTRLMPGYWWFDAMVPGGLSAGDVASLVAMGWFRSDIASLVAVGWFGR